MVSTEKKSKRNETSFRVGQLAWNKNGEWVKCATCGEEIYRNRYRLEKHKQQFCKRACVDTPSPARDEAVRLYKLGLKYREISVAMGKPIGTVSGLIHRARLTDRWGRGVTDAVLQKKVQRLLPKHCELCGYDRAVETAHIVPRSKGGAWELQNVLSLCPNCHYLFDRDRLTAEEQLRIAEVCGARKE